MKESGKKIGDKEYIGKDQCPTNDPFKVNLNSSSFSCCLNPENFLTNHLSLPQQICKQSANLWSHWNDLPVVQTLFCDSHECKTTQNN